MPQNLAFVVVAGAVPDMHFGADAAEAALAADRRGRTAHVVLQQARRRKVAGAARQQSAVAYVGSARRRRRDCIGNESSGDGKERGIKFKQYMKKGEWEKLIMEIESSYLTSTRDVSVFSFVFTFRNVQQIDGRKIEG